MRIRDGASGFELLPTNVYRARPVSTDQRYGQYLFTRELVDQAAMLLQTSIKPELGHLGAVFLDCANEFVPGMKIQLPEAALKGTATTYGFGNDVTADGGVIVLNVQPGCHELEGTLDGVVTHRARVFVEPGALSVTYVNPIDEVGDLGIICEPTFPW